MACNFTCNRLPIENVTEFKYLGLYINRAINSPTAMLEKEYIKPKRHLIKLNVTQDYWGLIIEGLDCN